MRRVIAFSCDGETLVGTLDAAAGNIGLLIVSGGNEVRGGAHRGMAQLAAAVAALGYPAFRFDRRGVGDSSGENGGHAGAVPDIAAALAAFRDAAPQLRRVVAFGNCDAATTLAAAAAALPVDALLLANPWLGGEPDGLPPRAAIAHRYRERLRHRSGWRDLVMGRVSLGGTLRGLRKFVRRIPAAEPWPLPPQPATVLLAQRDATAIAFAARWRSPAFATWRAGVRLVTLPTASHSFADTPDALLAAVLAVLGEA